MTDKELRRLNRSELLEMLIAQTEENRQLEIRLERAEAQLRDRRIAVEKAGSLAEAALQMRGILSSPSRARALNPATWWRSTWETRFW